MASREMLLRRGPAAAPQSRELAAAARHRVQEAFGAFQLGPRRPPLERGVCYPPRATMPRLGSRQLGSW